MEESLRKIILPAPNDFHVHLREGAILPLALKHTAEVFERAIVMPNLLKPVATVAEALLYKQNIETIWQAISEKKPAEADSPESSPLFSPLMALYLTENTSYEEVQKAAKEPAIIGFKYYPEGVTTNAASGIRQYTRVAAALAAMEEFDMPLLVHGESGGSVDVFDREQHFLDTTLLPLMQKYPKLRITLEHVSSKKAADFVASMQSPALALQACSQQNEGNQNSQNSQRTQRLKATLTLHHLLLTRNDLLGTGIRPHFYCKPIVKREEDRQALLAYARLGHENFFFGSDSAPHPMYAKEAAVGCAGLFTMPVIIENLLKLFEIDADSPKNSLSKRKVRLQRLKAFLVTNGEAHYKLAPNKSFLLVEKHDRAEYIPNFYCFGKNEKDRLVPFQAGQPCYWRFKRILHA